jgi:hypothetical protein
MRRTDDVQRRKIRGGKNGQARRQGESEGIRNKGGGREKHMSNTGFVVDQLESYSLQQMPKHFLHTNL